MYAVNESESSVSSFKIQENGTLSFINKKNSFGDAPCLVSFNKADNKAVVSNYVGGSIAL